LSEQRQAIGEIMLTVNDLAEQSNLLAVNASIELRRLGSKVKASAWWHKSAKSGGAIKQATIQSEAS